MVFVLDNYDSFTYNLVQYLGELGVEISVVRNDEVTVDEIAATRPAAIVISPGPGRPEDAGVTMDVIRELGAHDADSRRLPRPSGDRRGVRRIGRPGRRADARQDVDHRARRPRRLRRAHRAVRRLALSLAGRGRRGAARGARGDGADARKTAPSWACGIARCPVHGVQFHPESILTGEGRRILRNFLERRG